jgi:hypothetical protein
VLKQGGFRSNYCRCSSQHSCTSLPWALFVSTVLWLPPESPQKHAENHHLRAHETWKSRASTLDTESRCLGLRLGNLILKAWTYLTFIFLSPPSHILTGKSNFSFVWEVWKAEQEEPFNANLWQRGLDKKQPAASNTRVSLHLVDLVLVSHWSERLWESLYIHNRGWRVVRGMSRHAVYTGWDHLFQNTAKPSRQVKLNIKLSLCLDAWF